MTSKRSIDLESLPTLTLGHESWIQCQLRLLIRFQASHGVPLYDGEIRSRYPRIYLEDIFYSLPGQAIYNAMLGVEVREKFQSRYLEQREELRRLGAEDAARRAFNLVMDENWEKIDQVACEFLGITASSKGHKFDFAEG